LAQHYYLKALLICEKIDQPDYLSAIYMNIGSIYHYLNQNETAREYYIKSYEICQDTTSMILLLNNLGATELVSGKIESALEHINFALEVSKRHENAYLYSLLNNLASCYEHDKKYDSAFYYYRLALHHSRISQAIKSEATNLTALGKLFFEVKKIDSAQHYVHLSNKIASENRFLNILADNYLILSDIEKFKGRSDNALKFYEKYAELKDSINSAEVYGTIDRMQRQYEVSKTNQRIEELVIDAQVKENTIYYQGIIQFIISIALLLLGGILALVLTQNKQLKKSYKILVDKHIEVFALDDELQKIKHPEIHHPEPQNLKTLKPQTNYHITTREIRNDEVEKDSSCALSEDEQNELLKRILEEMDNTPVICHQDYSINKLADNLNSNQKYISYVINRALNKNFRSFLNSYRIKEAQRLIMELDFDKFTVNSVANNVGFKSYSGFYYAFKEITGVTPNFYFNSVQKKISRCIA
jgi:AraC-like DNA-binding protein